MTNLLVVGDGAIGLLLSYFLSSDNKITVLTRKPPNKTRFYNNKEQTSEKINAHFISLDELSTCPKFNTVLFTVKAFQVKHAFEQVKPYLTKQCAVVLSHNGMGNVEELIDELGNHQPLYFLTTSMAAFKIDHFNVKHTGEGQSFIGRCNDAARDNTLAINGIVNAVPRLKITQDIHRLRFEKLLVNIAINPLTALYNIKNGQLRAPQYSCQIMNLLFEGCQIAKAQGLTISLVDALNNAYSVMTLTAENYSSMQQDILHDRPTEIMSICGYISEQGKRYNIKAPNNDKLLGKILAKKSMV